MREIVLEVNVRRWPPTSAPGDYGTAELLITAHDPAVGQLVGVVGVLPSGGLEVWSASEWSRWWLGRGV